MMEEAENQVCENCKRDIPSANLTTHVVHCARNIRVCPACKEPVPVNELQAHHDAMHKPVPCDKCGESVCGADMEDHVRDSCAHTMQICRYCELELPRASLPAHGRYCGARTERCHCGEWVMMRYRQLHLDSNHGFIRLDDDPVPIQSVKTEPKSAKDKATHLSNGLLKNMNRPIYTKNGAFEANNIVNEPNTAGPSGSVPIHNIKSENSSSVNGTSYPVASTSRENTSNIKSHSNLEENLSNFNGAIPRTKRSNGHQVKQTDTIDKVKKTVRSSRGSVKKRPAPPPPALAVPEASASAASAASPAGPASAASAASLHGPVLARALQRQREEIERRMKQNQENMAKGLPPILSQAEKVERLRKMDALHNRDIDDQSWKNRLQGKVWSRPEVYPVGHMLGTKHTSEVNGEVRKELRNLKPMTPEEFNDRYRNIQTEERPDRFSEIKTSLRELRRGLNEVTAPYNSNSNNDSNHNRRDEEAPCEFCGTSVLLEDLVLHQTGCRPDLAQYRCPSPSRSSRRNTPSPSSLYPPPAPLIPCEFCAIQLPVHLVSHHQERCGRERNILYPD